MLNIKSGSNTSSILLIRHRKATHKIGNRCKNESDGYKFRGYIGEFRISNIVRWTEDFIPPTETAPVSGEFLLVVTMAEEVEKEYQLSKSEFDAFVSWYDNKSKGIGSSYYTFDKSFKRKDYLVFDKILTFEITDFTK